MSADLFAEFGGSSSQQQQPFEPDRPKLRTASTFSFFDDIQASQPQQPPRTQTIEQTADDDDDFGDFEAAEEKQDPFVFPSQSQISQPPQTEWERAPVFKAKKSHDSNILFDAEEDGEDEDDDFGAFSPAPPPATSTPSGLVDLLGDLEISQPPPKPTADRHRLSKSLADIPAPSKKNKAHGFGLLSKSKEPSSTSPTSTSKKEDTWDSFDDWEASIPVKQQEKRTSKPVTPNAAPTTLIRDFGDLEPGELPPTNVPPPGILLSVFPPLFAEAHGKLFKPMAAQTLPMRNRLLSEPATILYLQGFLALASVAARIIAGRKLRWKRDVHLSQGMRIGPASSRATSGMKLTGIDKSENMKEEREVADVVRSWKEQVGRLRHAVAAVNQTKADCLGSVPDLQETMAVRALKQSEGGIPARTPCLLCGLKREERLVADTDVEDSFGEWWIEQVSMHRGCRNFWREHKDRLRQR